MKRAVLVVVLCLFSSGDAGAQEKSSGTQEQPSGARVGVNGEFLFELRAGVGSLSAEERAEIVNRRLAEILASPLARTQAVVQQTDLGWMVTVGGRPVVAVTEADARAAGKTQQALAEEWAEAVEHGLDAARGRQVRETLVERILVTAILLVLTLLLLLALRKGRQVLERAMEERRERLPRLTFRELEIISPQRMFTGVLTVEKTLYYLTWAVVIGGALLIVFSQFPATERYARQVALWLWEPLVTIVRGVIGYLPNLFYILVIVLVTRLALRGIGFVFEQAHRGVISLEPWLHQDLARPTASIVKAVIVVLALFFIAPLIPGTGTTAAQGITVLLGLMVSFGSTSTVGNLIAGIVLRYMRPYYEGDRVKLGETLGDVVERRFLYTKVLTSKNEEVIVPSLQILGKEITNYSARARELGLILHTTVTIGYDAPWRKVHELLVRAAERTTHVLKDPKPFVLQTSLDDWYVSYQLNAYTNQPNRMAAIYAELHQNIQDSFNEGGIEIMSPQYLTLRDGNETTIPAEYRSKEYRSPRFRVEAETTGAARA